MRCRLPVRAALSGGSRRRNNGSLNPGLDTLSNASQRGPQTALVGLVVVAKFLSHLGLARANGHATHGDRPRLVSSWSVSVRVPCGRVYCLLFTVFLCSWRMA